MLSKFRPGGTSGPEGRNFRSGGGTSGPSGRNFRSQSDLRAVRRFGRKSGPKSFEFEENLALEAVGRWGNCRSTPKTSFYWSKTTNNSTNREIDPRPIWGYFLGKKFGKFLGEIGGIGGCGGQIRGNQRAADTI